MKNAFKALEAIEILVGSDFGLDMEWLLHEKKKIDPRLKMAAKIITDIYCISHCENSHTCKHPDWEAMKYKILSDYNKQSN